MTLRGRLALTILLTAIPIVAGVLYLRADLARRAGDEALIEFVTARMQAGGREICEAAPELFPGSLLGRGGPPPRRRGQGPRRGPHRLEIHAYYPDFRSANPRSPTFPEDLRSALERGRPFAAAGYEAGRRKGRQVAVRMEWDEGPCAIVLGRRLDDRPGVGGTAFIGSAAAICGALLVAVLLAAGPVVRRIRRLTASVRLSAAERYRRPVEVEGQDEIADLAEAFNDAAGEIRSHLESLEDRERTLRSFVGNTTHDVMLPLTVLQGHLVAMRKQIDGGAEVDREQIHAALEEVHYLTSLIHNLGAAARLESGESRLQRHPVDLNGVVERSVARHGPIARQRRIDLDYAVPEDILEVQGDVTFLEQAVSNVVHNAVRYNHAGGHVAVLLEETNGAARGFSLRVVDDGPGVPEDQLRRLTDRSYRGDGARTRGIGGSGLGLHIARDVAERHGFTLDIRRSTHGGLEVEMRGPVSGELTGVMGCSSPPDR